MTLSPFQMCQFTTQHEDALPVFEFLKYWQAGFESCARFGVIPLGLFEYTKTI